MYAKLKIADTFHRVAGPAVPSKGKKISLLMSSGQARTLERIIRSAGNPEIYTSSFPHRIWCVGTEKRTEFLAQSEHIFDSPGWPALAASEQLTAAQLDQTSRRPSSGFESL